MSKVVKKLYQTCDFCKSICDSCMERLRKILKPHIRLEIFDYGGGTIEWKEEKPE